MIWIVFSKKIALQNTGYEKQVNIKKKKKEWDPMYEMRWPGQLYQISSPTLRYMINTLVPTVEITQPYIFLPLILYTVVAITEVPQPYIYAVLVLHDFMGNISSGQVASKYTGTHCRSTHTIHLSCISTT